MWLLLWSIQLSLLFRVITLGDFTTKMVEQIVHISLCTISVWAAMMIKCIDVPPRVMTQRYGHSPSPLEQGFLVCVDRFLLSNVLLESCEAKNCAEDNVHRARIRVENGHLKSKNRTWERPYKRKCSPGK